MTVIVAVLGGLTLLLILRSDSLRFFAKLICKPSWQPAGVLKPCEGHAEVYVQQTLCPANKDRIWITHLTVGQTLPDLLR
jgi:hypothetical protein